MRDRSKTIAALRRLIERPGTPQEGETALRLLNMLGGKEWVPRPFNPKMFPVGTEVFYCYWCYRNVRGTIINRSPKMRNNECWLGIKFDCYSRARWVPVTSELGCHISLDPFEGNEEEILYRGDIDWQEKDREFQEKLRSLGIVFDNDLECKKALEVGLLN